MSWSSNENRRFENALAEYEEDTPGRFELVAQAVGGGRTADDVWRHFLKLEGDIDDMAAKERAMRRRHQYRRRVVVQQRQRQHQHSADADANDGNAATAANNNSRNNDDDRRRRSNNGGEGSSRNSNNNNNNSHGTNNNRANRPQE